jgi:hypothetical protein
LTASKTLGTSRPQGAAEIVADDFKQHLEKTTQNLLGPHKLLACSGVTSNGSW